MALGNAGHALAVVGAEPECDGQALDGQARIAFRDQVSDEVTEHVDGVVVDRAALLIIAIDQGRDVGRVTGRR